MFSIRLSALALLIVSLGVAVGCGEQKAPKGSSNSPAVAALANKFCPFMGEEVDEKVTVAWNDKTVGFCCDDCIPKWKKLSEEDKAKKLAEADKKGEHSEGEHKGHGKHEHGDHKHEKK